MYSTKPNLLLGFHGCEKHDQQKLLNNPEFFKISSESYDWLGHGMYFWENNPNRAIEWSEKKQKAGTLQEPAIIGAVLDLGHCLDLLDSANIELLKLCYILLNNDTEKFGTPLPNNIKHPKEKGNEKVLRYLDCAVIEYIHKYLKEKSEKPFDSVRAAFMEGNPIYPDAGFHERTHIQICIINPNCIKGVFLPRDTNKTFQAV